MPLLAKEPDLEPADLFSLSPDERPWVVVHVRSRQEKLLARHLHSRRVPFYLPQVERILEHAGRRRRAFHPLFPGYVFVRPHRAERAVIWRGGVVASLLEVVDLRQFGEELSQIRQLQLEGATFIRQVELVSGDAVCITKGAFSGYHGVIERVAGRERLIVRISLIRQAVAVEFDRAMLANAR